MAQHDRLDVAIRIRAENGTLAGICAAHGLPAKYAADLSRIARGLHVKPERYRMIGRALGVIDPPRNPIRLTVPDDLADAVQAARAQGRSTRDILTRGLGNG